MLVDQLNSNSFTLCFWQRFDHLPTGNKRKIGPDFSLEQTEVHLLIIPRKVIRDYKDGFSISLRYS